jgi:hypothetical protein
MATDSRWSTTRPAVSRATNPGPDTTHSVAIYDVSVDFASDRYDANSAAGYDANLDANNYGSKSDRGTRAAAILYSLLETAKLQDVEPTAYL